MLSTYLKLITSPPDSNVEVNILVYELVKTVAFYIHRDRKYIDEYKNLKQENSKLKKHIDAVEIALKNQGYIYNIDKDGIPIWNARMNQRIYPYLDENSNITDIFLEVWGDRKRFMDGRLWNTVDVTKLTIALTNFKRNNDVSDEIILRATKTYLSEFIYEDGGYKGLSNAQNFVSSKLINYIKTGSNPIVVPKAPTSNSYYDQL